MHLFQEQSEYSCIIHFNQIKSCSGTSECRRGHGLNVPVFLKAGMFLSSLLLFVLCLSGLFILQMTMESIHFRLQTNLLQILQNLVDSCEMIVDLSDPDACFSGIWLEFYGALHTSNHTACYIDPERSHGTADTSYSERLR